MVMAEFFMGDAVDCSTESVSNDGEDEFCAICHDDAISESSVTIPCNHVYCTDCIDHWLVMGRSVASCPLCMGVIECLVPMSIINKKKKIGSPYVVTRDGRKHTIDRIVYEWPPTVITSATMIYGPVPVARGRFDAAVEWAKTALAIIGLILLFIITHAVKYNYV